MTDIWTPEERQALIVLFNALEDAVIARDPALCWWVSFFVVKANQQSRMRRAREMDSKTEK